MWMRQAEHVAQLMSDRPKPIAALMHIGLRPTRGADVEPGIDRLGDAAVGWFVQGQRAGTEERGLVGEPPDDVGLRGRYLGEVDIADVGIDLDRLLKRCLLVGQPGVPDAVTHARE
jgi:hypothetical protein